MSSKFQKRVKSETRERWRFFHATDFHSLMYPCFTLCRILGIFPYKINNSNFEASKPHYIVSIIITCALCAVQLTLFYQFNIFIKITNFENASLSVVTNCYCILISFVTIATLVLSNRRMRLLQTIMEISSRLSSESYKKLSRLIHAKDIFGFLFVIGQMIIYFNMTNMYHFYYMILSMYTCLLVFTMDMLYMNCVCILKACFKEINNNLLHMQEWIINNQPRVPMMFHYERKNLFLIMKLKALKKEYLMISNTVQTLNIIFSLQLLCTIITVFLEIIFGLYFHVVQWNNGLFINLDKQLSTLFFFVTYQIIKMALLVWACETGKNQAEEIRTTIHDVLNSSRDEQIKNELHLFSLQLMHCENTFSIKGLNVDATLVTTMVRTITTYMIILLQFLIISHTCDGKSNIT